MFQEARDDMGHLIWHVLVQFMQFMSRTVVLLVISVQHGWYDMSRHVLTHRGLQIWQFFEPSFTRSKTCQDRSLFLSACFASFAFFCRFNWKQMHLFALFGMPRVSDTFACLLQPFLGRDQGRVHFGRYRRIGVTGFEPWSKVPGPCHPCWAGSEWPHAHVTWICLFLFRFPGLGMSRASCLQRNCFVSWCHRECYNCMVLLPCRQI